MGRISLKTCQINCLYIYWFFKKRKIISATIRAPNGIKKREWLNCLWYSRDSIGSVDELIRTSTSGANPAKKPIRLIFKILFLVAMDWARAAPTVPYDIGSMLTQ